jgi:hypothetical protein
MIEAQAQLETGLKQVPTCGESAATRHRTPIAIGHLLAGKSFNTNKLCLTIRNSRDEYHCKTHQNSKWQIDNLYFYVTFCIQMSTFNLASR